MVLQSHNSWSYVRPKKWWLRPFAFVAKCQSVPIYVQYLDYSVRSFDLRVRFDKNGNAVFAHGYMEFDISYDDLIDDLKFINSRKDCTVRVIHEVRNEKQYTKESIEHFKVFCAALEASFPNIKFYKGMNLYNYQVDYEFDYKPSEEGKYSSVCKPNIIDDWFPWLFARFNNKKILKEGSKYDILSIDFVNIR